MTTVVYGRLENPDGGLTHPNETPASTTLQDVTSDDLALAACKTFDAAGAKRLTLAD